MGKREIAPAFRHDLCRTDCSRPVEADHTKNLICAKLVKQADRKPTAQSPAKELSEACETGRNPFSCNQDADAVLRDVFSIGPDHHPPEAVPRSIMRRLC